MTLLNRSNVKNAKRMISFKHLSWWIILCIFGYDMYIFLYKVKITISHKVANCPEIGSDVTKPGITIYSIITLILEVHTKINSKKKRCITSIGNGLTQHP